MMVVKGIVPTKPWCVSARSLYFLLGILLWPGFISAPAIARPVIQGSSVTYVDWSTASGSTNLSGERNYEGRFFSDATQLQSSNLRTFNSINRYGRRTDLAASNPAYAGIIGPNESLVAHSFFKNNNSAVFFPGLPEGEDVTFRVENIPFDQPVWVVRSTFMFHTLWRQNQVDQLAKQYHHLHNLHTASNPFRNADVFAAGGLFSDFPHPGASYALGDVIPVFEGEGSSTLSLSITVPYDLLRSLEEQGHGSGHPPPGLPAPHGFLEPYHLHFEYLVVPEPASVLLGLPLAAASMFRRRRADVARSFKC